MRDKAGGGGGRRVRRRVCFPPSVAWKLMAYREIGAAITLTGSQTMTLGGFIDLIQESLEVLTSTRIAPQSL